MPDPTDRLDPDVREAIRHFVQSDVAAALRTVAVAEAKAEARRVIAQELSNGWGESRKLVEELLRQGVEERKEIRSELKELKDITTRQTAIQETVAATLAELKTADVRHDKSIGRLNVDVAKQSALWASIVSLGVAVITYIVAPFLKAALGG